MPDVNLVIHGRTYGVGCDDGQEKRVRELGQYIDRIARDIGAGAGTTTEAHLMVLSALVLADELFEARTLAPAASLGTTPNQDQALDELMDQLAARDQDIDRLRTLLADRDREIAELQNQADDLQSQVDDLEDQLTAPDAGVAATLGAATVRQAANMDDPQVIETIDQLASRLDKIVKRMQAM